MNIGVDIYLESGAPQQGKGRGQYSPHSKIEGKQCILPTPVVVLEWGGGGVRAIYNSKGENSLKYFSIPFLPLLTHKNVVTLLVATLMRIS